MCESGSGREPEMRHVHVVFTRDAARVLSSMILAAGEAAPFGRGGSNRCWSRNMSAHITKRERAAFCLPGRGFTCLVVEEQSPLCTCVGGFRGELKKFADKLQACHRHSHQPLTTRATTSGPCSVYESFGFRLDFKLVQTTRQDCSFLSPPESGAAWRHEANHAFHRFTPARSLNLRYSCH